MKKSVTVLILLLAVLVSFSSPHAEKNQTYTLTVKVQGLRNSKGIVQFALYNRDGTIPDEAYKNYYKKQNGTIHEGSSYTVFSNLPKGVYAVNILHDENMNGKIDKGFILPIEGIGFTNYTTIGLKHRPNFSKASFELLADREEWIKIIYL